MSNTDPNSFAPNLAVRGSAGLVPRFDKYSLSSTDAASRLISSSLWTAPGAPLTITYGFRRDGISPVDAATGFQAFNVDQIDATEKALAAWSAVADIHFIRMADSDGFSDDATILFGNYLNGPNAGFGVLPGTMDDRQGDVWINASLDYNVMPTLGNYGGEVLVHEIGHALGLTHPGDYDGDDVDSYAAYAGYYEDDMRYTVMSYFPDAGVNPGDYRGAYPYAPEIDDITAAQRLYGANLTTNAGNTSYGFNAADQVAWPLATGANATHAIWDAGGIDLIDLSGQRGPQTIDLRQGGISASGLSSEIRITIAYGTVIENATAGNGGATMIGNEVGNVLTGGSGADHLYGEGGDDTLIGGAGTDTLDGGSGTNVVDGGDGSDELLLPGYLGDYLSTLGGDGRWTIRGAGITDIVSNIETVRLRDGPADAGIAIGFGDFTATTPVATVATRGIHGNVATDVNGDGRADLLVSDSAGAVVVWHAFDAVVSGLLPALTLTLAEADRPVTLPAGATIAATGDFDGDHRADLLLRLADGSFSVWNGTAQGFAQNAYTIADTAAGWAIAATGDLSGDGKDDLLWRNDAGDLAIWRSNGRGFAGVAYVGPPLAADWQVDGLGDFNGDGHADLLIRQAGGTVKVILGSANGFGTNPYAEGRVATSWSVAGVADLTGDGKDDILWRNTDGTMTVWAGTASDFSPGALSTSAFGYPWQAAEVGDFDGDGRADVLLRQPDAGTSVVAYSTGNGFRNSTTAYGLAPESIVFNPGSVHRRSAADLGADGHSDLIWRNANGAMSTWQLAADGSRFQQSLNDTAVDPAWKIVDTFDFNGDGAADLLWRHAGGAMSIWTGGVGGQLRQGVYTDGSVGNDWRIAGVGDVDGDGRGDILWQQDGGAISAWSSTGTGFRPNSYYHGSPGNGWVVEGLADLDADGRADIVWRNANGAVATWLANDGGFAEGGYYSPNASPAWHMVGLADFNGDGRADILWRNDDGTLTMWRSNGSGFDQGAYTTSIPTAWHVAAVEDLNGDGKGDIVWRNDDGSVQTWQSTGSGFTQAVFNGAVDPGWSLVGHAFPL